MSQSNEKWDILEIAAKATQFIEKNFKAAMVVFVVALVGASVFAFMKNAEQAKEEEAFNSLFKVTKNYSEIKEGFEKAKAQEEEKKAGKPKKTPLPMDNNDPKKDEKVYAKATGDMDKDYGEVVGQLETFVTSNSGLQASGEAALMLSEIYGDYDQATKGAEVLSKTLSSWKTKNILFHVMQMRAGDMFASSGDCEKASNHWEKVVATDNFLKNAAQLKLAVCLQKMGRVDDAKARLQTIEAKDPKSSEAFSAKRYLRYLKFMNKVPQESTENKADTSENKGNES